MTSLFRRQSQTSKTFADSEIEELWSRLNRWYANVDRGITKDKYLSLQEKMGKEPDLEKMPPDISDFPYDVQIGISVYNKLGDRYSPEYGYLGKDYTNVRLFAEIHKVDNLELFLETILRIDEKLINKDIIYFTKKRIKSPETKIFSGKSKGRKSQNKEKISASNSCWRVNGKQDNLRS